MTETPYTSTAAEHPIPQPAAPEAPVVSGDAVDRILDRVRRDLAAKRASGELPEPPLHELERQFTAIVEAVDAGLVEEPPLDPGILRQSSALETWRPSGPGLKRRLTRPVAHATSRAIGAVVRRQVQPFAARSTALLEQLVHRQNRTSHFLTRVHLDRVRGLEWRIAELERELDRLRTERSGPESAD